MKSFIFNNIETIELLFSFQSGITRIKRQIKYYIGINDEIYDRISPENRRSLYKIIKKYQLKYRTYTQLIRVDNNNNVISLYVNY